MGYYLKSKPATPADKASEALLASVGFLKFSPTLLQRQLVEDGFNQPDDFVEQIKKILGHHKKVIEDEFGDQLS